MAKYINADELKEKLEEHRSKPYDDYIDGKNYMIEVAKKLLAEMPSADVVEVVRCKDCKWYQNGFCDKVDALLGLIRDNDYCSYGERKETK